MQLGLGFSMFLDALASLSSVEWTVVLSVIALLVSALSALFTYTEASTFKKMYSLEKQEYDLHKRELELHEKELDSENRRFLLKNLKNKGMPTINI